MYPLPRPPIFQRLYIQLGRVTFWGGILSGLGYLAIHKRERKLVLDTAQDTIDDPKGAGRKLHKAAKDGFRRGREWIDSTADKAEKLSKTPPPPKPSSNGWSIFSWLGWNRNRTTLSTTNDNNKRPPGP